MVKNEPLKFARTIWQVLSIGCFLICAATFGNTAKADYGQTIDYSTIGNAVANVYQDLGTGLSGNLTAVEVYSACYQNYGEVRLRSCLEENYNPETHQCSSYYATYYQDPTFSNTDGVWGFHTANFSPIGLSPSAYYFLLFNPSSGDICHYAGTTNANDYQNGDIDTTLEYNLTDFYFNLIGVEGPNYDTTATTTWPADFIIGDPSSQNSPTSTLAIDCCAGRECLFPISFGKDQHNATLSWALDPDYCAADFMTWDSSITADWYAGTPTAFVASSTISAGNHNLCVLWSNGASSSLTMINFDAWGATNTICAAKDAYDAIHAKDPYTLACTAEEWATPDPTLWDGGPSIAAFNLVKIKCLILETAYSVAQMPADVITGVTNQVVKLFPINVFYKIQKSVNDAPTNPFPEEVSFLKITDDEGNVNLTIPALLSPTQQKETLTVFGPDLFMQDATSTLIFGQVRSMSYYFLWALFFIGLVVSALIWKFKQEKDE